MPPSGMDGGRLAGLGLADMPTSPRIPPTRRRIELLAFPGINLLDLAGPLQVLAAADEQAGGRAYDLRVVAAASPVPSSATVPKVNTAATSAGPSSVSTPA